jgi:DNA polymerase-3 subunit delta
MDEALKIINDIKAGTIKPIYLLMGEEPYYIDKLTEYIENNILTDDEKGFNQMVLYGKDTTVDEVVSNAKRYPMMADRQVVIVKEAQELSRTFDQFAPYFDNFQPTTVLVLAYKYKSVDKRKKWLKDLSKNGVVFESLKIKDYKMGEWVKRVLQGRGYSIDAKANAMLVEYLGNDLSRISKEIEKLEIVLPKGTMVLPLHIEDNVGISKDYNVFEFRKALGTKNVVKSYQIAQYFADNSKSNPMVLVVGQLFSFFSSLLKFHGLSDKSPANVAKQLAINPYFVDDYVVAARNYPMKKVSSIIENLRDLDVKSKGVGASNLSDNDLYKELLAKIFN